MTETSDTLKLGEPHPSALSALEYIRSIPPDKLGMYRESLASSAMSGNRLAEVCFGTLLRLINGEPVSDRYLLGLAWTLMDVDRNFQENEFVSTVSGIARTLDERR